MFEPKVTFENGVYIIKSPYKMEFVDALKAAIPPVHRFWDSNRFTWSVSGQYRETLARLLAEHYGYTQVLPVPMARRSYEKNQD